MRVLPLFLSVLLFTGCDPAGGGDDDFGGVDCQSGTLAASVGGASFSAQCVAVTFENGVLAFAGVANVDGSDGARQRQINITIPSGGTGTFGAPIAAVMVYTDAGLDGGSTVAGTAVTAISGSVVVESYDGDSASGTFAFSGPEIELSGGVGQPGSGTPTGRTVSVTDGTFDIRD